VKSQLLQKKSIIIRAKSFISLNQKELAIQNLKEMIELDATHQEAKVMLEELKSSKWLIS